MTRFVLVFSGLLLVAGCTKSSVEGPGGIRGETGSAGSSLAYEHTVTITLSASQIPVRMSSVREACVSASFAECSLLRFEETAGDRPSGTLVIRLAPEGVEPIVALAAEDGVIGSHVTRAEDLAEPVADMGRRRERLESQRSILHEFQRRTNLSVADMLSIARELSSLESQLAEIERGEAALGRRVETNLLTLRYATVAEHGGWSRIRTAIGESVESFVSGSIEAIELAAFGLPFVLLAFPVALLWRWLWRRATGRRRSDAS
jgi:hypothetical protein